MQQIKIFKGIESECRSLENEVNAWLRQSGAKVISITGNIAPQSRTTDSAGGTLGGGGYVPSDVVLFVLYESPPG